MFSDDEHSGEHWNFPAGIDGRQEASEHGAEYLHVE